MEAIVRDCGSSGRTYKSALIFSAPDAGVNVRDAARNVLAWEDIDDDEDTKKLVTRATQAARPQPDRLPAAISTKRLSCLSARVPAGKDNKLGTSTWAKSRRVRPPAWWN